MDDPLGTSPEDNEEGSNVVSTKVHMDLIKPGGGLRDVTPLQRRRVDESGRRYYSAHGMQHRWEKCKSAYHVKEENVASIKQLTECEVVAGDLVCGAFTTNASIHSPAAPKNGE